LEARSGGEGKEQQKGRNEKCGKRHSRRVTLRETKVNHQERGGIRHRKPSPVTLNKSEECREGVGVLGEPKDTRRRGGHETEKKTQRVGRGPQNGNRQNEIQENMKTRSEVVRGGPSKKVSPKKKTKTQHGRCNKDK